MYFSLGSNLGDREKNLRAAVAGLSGIVRDLRVSSLYETDPMYVTDQPRFLNIAAAGRCGLRPELLLARIQALEAKLGRERRHAVPKGPRVIDIDILLYGDLVLQTADLQIPHPRLRERQFVLVPLLEIDPAARDPRDGRPYDRISQALGRQGAQGAQGVYMFGPWTYTGSSGDT